MLIGASAHAMDVPFRPRSEQAKKNLSSQLIAAEKKGNLGLVNQLIAAGADLNYRNKYGSTALMLAARRHAKIAQALINAGADLNLQNRYGYTALIAAAVYGQLESSQALIHAGADVNIQDEQGYTAMVGALQFNHFHIAKLLITHMLKNPMPPEKLRQYPLTPSQKSQVTALMHSYKKMGAYRDAQKLVGKELKRLLQTKNMITDQVIRAKVGKAAMHVVWQYLEEEVRKLEPRIIEKQTEPNE